MRFYVRDLERRAAARETFARDCERIRRGLPPERVLETDIYVTKRCNLRCSYCYFRDYFDGGGLPEDPSLERLQALVDRLAGKTYCLVILGGEPFSRPDFVWFLEYARRRDIFSIRVSTNGLYLVGDDGERGRQALPYIDRLSVSFDCTRSKEYPRRMQQLLAGLAALRQAQGDDLPRVCLAWTTAPGDDFERHVRPLLDYALENRFEIKFLPVKKDRRVDWAYHRQIVLRALEYAGPEWVTNDPRHTEKLSDRFARELCLQQIQYYIDFEGQFLYPCDEFPEQKVGSVYEYGLDELWQAGLRRYSAYPRPDGVCGHCPSGCHSDNSHIFRFPERQLRDLA